MQLTKKQMEFWTVILVFCIAISVLILVVDFGIKAAILEESTRLRLKIEEWENGRKPAQANTIRADNDASIDPAISPGLLVVEPTGMETKNVSNGDSPAPKNPPNRGRSKSTGQIVHRTIQDGNE